MTNQKKRLLHRGMGRVFKKKRRDPKNPKRWLYSRCWWVQYYHHRQVRKPSKTEDYNEAVRFLKKQIELAHAGKLLPLEAERMKFSDLVIRITRDYSHNQRRSLDRVNGALKHLTGYFGMSRALEISKDMIEGYLDYRLEIDKASNATVKYEISILKRMFHLAQSTLGRIPEFPSLRVSNIRKGFFEKSEFQVFIEHFEEDLKPLLTFAYWTGWRMKSEIFPLAWSQVDFAAGEVRLEPGTTKTDEGRTFPFTAIPQLEQLLKSQKEKTERLEREQLQTIPWVFHRNGKRITRIRSEWKKALEASGIGHKIPHDFRRTAVRNFERAGVPRSVAMKLVGHKTEAIYRRYAIVAKNDLVDGIKKLADYHSGAMQNEAEIVRFPA